MARDRVFEPRVAAVAGALEAVLRAIDGAGSLEDACEAGLQALAALPADAIVQVIAVARSYGRLYTFWVEPSYASPDTIDACRKNRLRHLDALRRVPRLAWIFLLHGDGFVREEAFSALNVTPETGMNLTALVYGLNDGVAGVRVAAAAAARRLLPLTCPCVVVAAAPFLLRHRRYFERLGERDAAMVAELLGRTDVLAAIEQDLLTRKGDRAARFLRHVMGNPTFDAALPKLASGAALGAVRAIALQALLTGEVRSLTGFPTGWVDRRSGLKSAEVVRPLQVSVDADSLLVAASDDKAAAVRKVVASAVIARADGARPEFDAIMERYAADPWASVRWRAEFYLKKRRQASPPG